VILRARQAGWSRDKIGSHIVRNNTIFNCEQTGIAGSMGAAFSQISNNHIYDIWTKRQFTGAEIAGIKLHGAIDVVIRNNHIHNAGRGLWMDWMAQGTRISSNVLYDNTTDDLFVEVNHGPFLVDNNIFLSNISLLDMSEGGAYVHNLMAGRIVSRPEPRRSTPYHKAHSTELAGLDSTTGDDNRFYNNVFVGGPPRAEPEKNTFPQHAAGYGLWVYDHREFPLITAGNVYLAGARQYVKEPDAVKLPNLQPQPGIRTEGGSVFLHMKLDPAVRRASTQLVSTEMLGKSKVTGLPYENAGGTPITIDTDYFGHKRNKSRPSPGPIENLGDGDVKLKVW
jgi:hypothetical protein